MNDRLKIIAIFNLQFLIFNLLKEGGNSFRTMSGKNKSETISNINTHIQTNPF